MADKPKPKAAPPKPAPAPRGFDPNKTRIIPDNPNFVMGERIPEEDDAKGEYLEQQRSMPPSRRDNPVVNFCKGGKVISTRKF